MLDSAEVALPVRSVLRKISNATFRLGQVSGVDFAARTVATDHGEIAFDYLLLCAGSVNNYFGHLGLAQSALALNDLGEALALRNHVLACCERSVWTEDQAERRRLLTFVVVGGGPTGVEFVGSLSELLYGVLAPEIRELDIEDVQLVLVDGGEAPLPPFAPSLRRAAARALEKRRVRFQTGHVIGVEDGVVQLEDGSEIAAGTVVWAAGVRAEPLAEGLGLELRSQRRVPVDATLAVPSYPGVFAAGDLAEILQNGHPLPMLAQVAMQSGKHAARSIRAQVEGTQPTAFRYRDLGIMATVGRNEAVAQAGRLKLSGFLGWAAWLVVHMARIIGVRARISIFVDWIAGYLMTDRPARFIARPRPPEVPQEPADAAG